MNKRFFYWSIISIAVTAPLFAVETVRFQEQTYSGSVPTTKRLNRETQYSYVFR